MEGELKMPRLPLRLREVASREPRAAGGAQKEALAETLANERGYYSDERRCHLISVMDCGISPEN